MYAVFTSIFRAKLSSLRIICSLGQVKLSLDNLKYLMTIYLSLGKYQVLLFPHSWLYQNLYNNEQLYAYPDYCPVFNGRGF